MAIFHCNAHPIGRGSGRSIVAAAAYITASKITDERTGLIHNFRNKSGVIFAEIMPPNDAPSWSSDRDKVWNYAEQAENKSTRRATATTGREFRIAIPNELASEARISVVREFVLYLVNTYSAIADYAIHAPSKDGDEKNFHAHILISDRVLENTGFSKKIRVLNVANGGRCAINEIRSKWAHIANRYLEAAGVHSRIDHRSNAARGIDAEPTVHLGQRASGMERKGEASDIGDINRAINARNALRQQLKAERAAHGTETATQVAPQHPNKEEQHGITEEIATVETKKARPLTNAELRQKFKDKVAADKKRYKQLESSRIKPSRSR